MHKLELAEDVDELGGDSARIEYGDDESIPVMVTVFTVRLNMIRRDNEKNNRVQKCV